MYEINKKQIEIKEKTGTRYQSKKLLIDCESQYEYLYNIGFSKNESNIYKLMRWLEENNQINNHTIEANSKIYIPEDREDYIKIISKDAPLAKGAKYTREEFEIRYENTQIFKHRYLPGKNREDQTKDSEDMQSSDMDGVEIVEKNPMLYSFFKDLNHFISLRDSVAKQLVSKGLSTNTSEYFQEIQRRIEALNESIIEASKQEMEWLIKTCSQDSEWRKLAIKLYNRFCSNNSSDLKNDKLLNKLFSEHEKTKTCINEFKTRFEKYLKKYNYDIVSFLREDFQDSVFGEYTYKEEKGIRRPIFGDFPNYTKVIKKLELSELQKLPEYKDALKGPTLCFHDIQGFTVNAEEIKIKNGVFSCKLAFAFYDHFGLDSGDLISFDKTPLRAGFQGWYILQHFNGCETGCKPFIDHAYCEEALEIKIEE